jgi:hypothetical protein
MPQFFEKRNQDDQYARLKLQIATNYPDDDYRKLLLSKIDLLKQLDEKYSDKQSIKQAFAILDDISRKEFTNFNTNLIELQKKARDDVQSFSFIKTFISLILLPLLIPIVLLESLATIAAAYQYMIFVQIALIALAIALTLVFLQPLVLLATIPAALIIGHFLSEFVLEKVMEQIIRDVGLVFQSLFYVEDEQLKQGLEDIINTVEQAQNQVEGSPVRRFFNEGYKSFFNFFGCNSPKPSELHSSEGMQVGLV